MQKTGTEKKENTPAAGEDQSFIQKRRLPRYRSLAGFRIDGYEGRALLKDINASGLCLQSRTFVSLEQGVKYTLHIAPENRMDAFDLVVEIRWTRSEINRFDAGFAIVENTAKGALEKYIEYLKSQKSAK